MNKKSPRKPRSISLTDWEWKLMQKEADKLDISVSGLIRKMLVKLYMKERLNERR